MSKEPVEDGLSGLLLGKDIDYPQQYDAAILCPIPRAQSRLSLGIEEEALPFYGEDIWNAYELSWLNSKGKPLVCQAEFRFPVNTPAIVESKSFKLYLNSLNQTRFDSSEALINTLSTDLSAVVAGPVLVKLNNLSAGGIADLPGMCLDSLDIAVIDYQFNPDYLCVAESVIEEQLHSHLLRSLCPVTGQPDWASVFIAYRGPAIDHEGLLRYIIGYRQHQEFHEQCVERIYTDILSRCQPEKLQVFARYLRRGGLDINPYRSSEKLDFSNLRLQRQ